MAEKTKQAPAPENNVLASKVDANSKTFEKNMRAMADLK
jgi:hypothetical protein